MTGTSSDLLPLLLEVPVYNFPPKQMHGIYLVLVWMVSECLEEVVAAFDVAPEG